ncbi:MAG: hypothetical protein LRY73_06605 [Bacillus sp. (in: Bacteria)]|nr:hypothetical protein [Bacillus sp. (in: firmicutes)]
METVFKRSIRKKKLLYIVGTAGLAYLAIIIFFYFLQDSLTFYPQSISEDRLTHIRQSYENVEEVKLTTMMGETFMVG